MPHYCHLATNLDCPTCGTLVYDLIYFQWGFSPGYLLNDDYLYHVGDTIQWQATKDGSVLSWVYFLQRDGDKITLQGANLGDPAIRNLLVRDAANFFWQQPEERQKCQICNTIFEGAIIEIREGIIRGARIYLPGEYGNHAELYIIDPTGILKPMPEWDDRPMGNVYNLLPDQSQ